MRCFFYSMKTRNLLFILIILSLFNSCKQDDDIIVTAVEINENVQVYNPNGLFDGYVLYNPISSKVTYLINKKGYIVKKWVSNNIGLSVQLKSNGHLVRSYKVDNPVFSFGGLMGGIEEFDFDGNLIWDWKYSTNEYTMHHDLAILPNGNILATVWDLKTAEEAISNGRNPDLLRDDAVWAERIIEIKPRGTNNVDIVWQWSVWDHLVQDFDATKLNFDLVSAHPELIDLNYTIGDANLNHINSLFYIEEFDQILFSSRRFNEIMIIDHSTNTAEASSNTGGNFGKGGDLLYRWGNPEAYKMGSQENKKLYGQHDATYLGSLPKIGGGNFMVFNNDAFEGLSSINEIKIPQLANGAYNLQPNTINLPTNFAWTYTNPEIYAPRVSGASRLENGNTLISHGTQGLIYEIDPNGNLLWKYKIPLNVNNFFKAQKYSSQHPAFEGIEFPILENQRID